MSKIKKILKSTIKFAVAIVLVMVGVLVICGLPLGDIKDSLKQKLEKIQWKMFFNKTETFFKQDKNNVII